MKLQPAKTDADPWGQTLKQADQDLRTVTEKVQTWVNQNWIDFFSYADCGVDYDPIHHLYRSLRECLELIHNLQVLKGDKPPGPMPSPTIPAIAPQKEPHDH